ncbi:hypothetical protein D3C83_64790 [compost metagenome]
MGIAQRLALDDHPVVMERLQQFAAVEVGRLPHPLAEREGDHVDAVLRTPADRIRAARAVPQRRVRPLDRAQRHRHPVEGVILPVEIEHLG